MWKGFFLGGVSQNAEICAYSTYNMTELYSPKGAISKNKYIVHYLKITYKEKVDVAINTVKLFGFEAKSVELGNMIFIIYIDKSSVLVNLSGITWKTIP